MDHHNCLLIVEMSTELRHGLFPEQRAASPGHHWLVRPTELPKDLRLHHPLRKQNIESAGVQGLQGQGTAPEMSKAQKP